MTAKHIRTEWTSVTKYSQFIKPPCGCHVILKGGCACSSRNFWTGFI